MTDHDAGGFAGSSHNSTDAPAIGGFRYDVPGDAWTWTPEAHALLGVARGTVPTTDMLLTKCHPDDRPAVLALFERVLTQGGEFSLLHKVARGGVEYRDVVVLGESTTDDDGAVRELTGYFLDLTDTLHARGREQADLAVTAAVATRGSIEQAKGVLRLAYGLSDEEAFAMLADWSSRRNVKVQVLSQRLVEVVGLGAGSSHALRTRLDQVLDTITRSPQG